jgi:hypothetical protein
LACIGSAPRTGTKAGGTEGCTPVVNLADAAWMGARGVRTGAGRCLKVAMIFLQIQTLPVAFDSVQNHPVEIYENVCLLHNYNILN